MHEQARDLTTAFDCLRKDLDFEEDDDEIDRLGAEELDCGHGLSVSRSSKREREKKRRSEGEREKGRERREIKTDRQTYLEKSLSGLGCN